MTSGVSWLSWRNWSLTARLMVGSGTALLLSAVVLLYSSLRTDVDATRRTLEERLNDEVDFLLPTITEQAVVGDYANIERLLKVRVRREEIDRFSWTDEQGNRIKVEGEIQPRDTPEWFIRWVDIPYLERSHEVTVGGVRYGKISFLITPQPAMNRLWSGLLEKLQIFTLGVGVFFAAIIQILTSGLQPLYRLATGARRFGQGDYSVRLPAEGAPEMLDSIKAFNNMADSIDRLVTSLRESEARKRLLATIVEQSDEAIFTVNLNAYITSWNAAAQELFGYSAQEVVGKEYGILIPSEYRKELNAPERIRAGQKLLRETRMVTKNGTIIDVEISAAPMFDDFGAHTGEIAIARDVTERKRTQEQLLMAKQAAEDASRAKSDFVANMSHEIRTPMNGILGFTELVLDSELTAEQRENVNAVKSSAESLLGVINDILDFSKIEAGRLDIEAIPFSLRDALGRTLKPLELRAQQKKLRLSWHVDADTADRIVGDPVRLGQVIVNLVGNAIKFTNRGEIEVRVNTQQRSDTEARLLFSVRDTGIGIAAEKQRLIFEAFSQADMSTTREFGGTGLGLTIASRLVELMGGSITVDSEPGKGSHFRFDVKVGVGAGVGPLAMPVAEDRPNAALERAAQGHTRALSILVAEDNPVNQKFAVRLLEKLGHRVYLVENGQEAIDAVKSRRFDTVLLDVQMPVMGGLAACIAIREWERDRGTRLPIVAMTAHAMQGDRERCLEAGMDDYISKPIDINQLVATIESLTGAAAPGSAAGGNGASPPPVVQGGNGQQPVDLESALARMNHDRKLLCEIMGLFSSECPKSIAQIEQALERGDHETVYRMAHKFKGSAGTVAATTLVPLALELEMAGRSADMGRAGELLGELKRETRRLLPLLGDIAESLRRENADL